MDEADAKPVEEESPAVAENTENVADTSAPEIQGESVPEESEPAGPAGDADAAAAPEEASGAPEGETILPAAEVDEVALKAKIEAIVYVAEESITPEQIASVLEAPPEIVKRLFGELVAGYSAPERGLMIREVASGFKMGTKPEHHEAVRAFAKSLKPPLKLSLAALETLATIAYKQPITAPEIMEIRGVQGAGVLKTLLDRKLIHTSGRKNVIGRPMLYRTTREFLVHFGLKDLSELPTLKEFEELRRLAISEDEREADAQQEFPQAPAAEENAAVESAMAAETSPAPAAEGDAPAADGEAAEPDVPQPEAAPEPAPEAGETAPEGDHDRDA